MTRPIVCGVSFVLLIAGCSGNPAGGPGGSICTGNNAPEACGRPCNGESDCGAGFHCSTGVCDSECTATGNECGDGYVCGTLGYCLSPTIGNCDHLACYQSLCPDGQTTSLSGTVFAPNGTLPLYNAIVYVPNGEVSAFPEGLTCDRCDSVLSGNPLVMTTTDSNGQFTLKNVPATSEVPLVVQVGKWRRQVSVPVVASCEDTALDGGQTRLPRNQSEGDMPLMALSTGGADALECLLRKVGIDDSEFATSGGDGRVHFYAGTGGTKSFNTALGGGTFADDNALWDTLPSLSQYDVVLLSCEGNQNADTKSANARQALHDYANAGGRVFASHWHNYWIQAGAGMWPQTATFNFQSDLNDISADIDTSYGRGNDLADWLVNVGASLVRGKIDITAAQHTITGVNPTYAQRMIYKDTTANSTPSVQYYNFTTPLDVPVSQQCGRVVFSDIHVSSGDASSPDTKYPNGCTTTELSPQEKVLAFMLFDIASCIGPIIE